MRAWIAVSGLVFLLAPGLLADEDEGWPREIETGRGLVTMYQPQIDALDADSISARAAVSVLPEGGAPIFGAVWLEGRGGGRRR